jgi:hypothetical protein
MVDVVDRQPTQTFLGDAATSGDDRECGDFGLGLFAWKRDGYRLFDRPIPNRGRLGICDLPDALIPSEGGFGIND